MTADRASEGDAASAAARRVPRMIGDYELVEVLGRGGMGVVYVAIDTRNGLPAALKTVRAPSESTLASIRREIQMLRELRHPGVVRIRDTGVAAGVPWYAMDLLRGHTLLDFLRAWYPTPPAAGTADLRRPDPGEAAEPDGQGPTVIAPSAPPPPPPPVPPAASSVHRTEPPPFHLATCLTIFRRICEPLAYVHGQGVVHRDLTPSNVFVTPGGDAAGRPVLVDFGIASQFRTDSAREVLEVGGFTRGTAHYMAPEQARGEVVDARADVYAFGCVLYEALTGRPPFLGASPLVVMMQHLEEPPLPPSHWNPLLSPAIDELVLHLLAKRPRERLGYVVDVAKRLEQLGAAPPRAEPTLVPRSYTYRPLLAGRDAWLAAFDRKLAALADGRGAAVFLIGESGVGKTRLAAAIATRAVERDLRVIAGETDAVAGDARHGAARATPLHPLRPLLRALAERCREGLHAVERLLGSGGAVLAPYEPELAEVLDVRPPDDSAGSPTVGAAATRHRVISVLRDALAELAVGEPLVLVLDDLQWADELTLGFVASLSPALLAERGILLIATVRAEELTAELADTITRLRADRLDLGRLDRPAVGEMVRDMLALDEAVPALTDFLVATSEGNPFFAAEYLRAAVDEGLVRRDDRGRWRLVARDEPSYDRLPIPTSIHDLVRRRLAGLGDHARRVVAAAAVLGRESDVEVLTATAGLSTDEVGQGIIELMRRYVIDEAPGGRIRFEHDKLREIAHADIAHDDRRELHRAAAHALETHSDDDRALHLPALAHHWEAAEDYPRAARALAEAAEHALRYAAFGQAAMLLRHLLALPIDAVADAAPGNRDPQLPLRGSFTHSEADRARWERWLGEASYALGDLPSCARHTKRALLQLGRPMPSGRNAWARVIAAGIGRQLVRGVRRAGRAPDAARQEAALAAARLTSCYFFDDDALGLVGASLIAVNLAEQAGVDVAVAEAYANLGYVAGVAKLAPIARGYFARARDTAARTGDELGMIKALYAEAGYHIGVGAWPRARTVAAEAQARARRQRNPQEIEVGDTILGHVDFCAGAYGRSLARSQALLASARGRDNRQHQAWGLYTAGRIALHRGQLELADQYLGEARAVLASLSDRASHLLCNGMHAWVLAGRGDRAGALALADDTTRRIGRRVPSVFTIAEGFIGAAEAYLMVARAARAEAPAGAMATAALAAAVIAIGNLERFARTFPLARPAAARLEGERRGMIGDAPGAARLLARSLAAAERLAMPYDRMRAHRGLAAVLGGAEAEAHGQRADALFVALAED